MKEKKDRVDDALRATRAAIEEGIVPGGGVAYIRALESLEGLEGDNADETTGIHIIKRAIEEPLRQICANAGKEGAVVVQKVREGRLQRTYRRVREPACSRRGRPRQGYSCSAGERRFYRRHVPDNGMCHRREEGRQARNADEPRYGWHGRHDVIGRFPLIH